MGTVFGIHWALPLGHDRPVVLSVVAAGIVNVIGAFLLVPRLGALGMAVAVIAAESTVLLGLLWFAMREGSMSLKSGEPRSRAKIDRDVRET
jgi:O-antigen/teichoic acid export membrane protein